MSTPRFNYTCPVGHVPRHVLHVLVFLFTCNLLLLLSWTSMQDAEFKPETYEGVIDEPDSKPFIKRGIFRDPLTLERTNANTHTRAKSEARKEFYYRPEDRETPLKNNSLLFRNLQSISKEIQDNENVIFGQTRLESEKNSAHSHVSSHNDPINLHNNPVGPRNYALVPRNKEILLETLQPAHNSQLAQLNTKWINEETGRRDSGRWRKKVQGGVLAGGHDKGGHSGAQLTTNSAQQAASVINRGWSKQGGGTDRVITRDTSYSQNPREFLFEKQPHNPAFQEQPPDRIDQEPSRDAKLQKQSGDLPFHDRPRNHMEPKHDPAGLPFRSIRYMHNPLDACAPNSEDGRRAHSLLLVHSAPGNKPQREAIRSTWGRQAARIVREEDVGSIQLRVVFVLGAPSGSDGAGSAAGAVEWARVRREAALYRDLLVGDFADTYANLTLKALFALRWAHIHCNSTVYTLKTDDDTFLHVEALRAVLSGPRLSPLFGALNVDSAVERVGRWGVSRALFPAARYPPYCTGCLYVLATRLLPALLSSAHSVTPLPLEDVYVTGLLAGHVGVTCRQHAAFPKWHESAARLRERCRLARGELLALHAVPPERMRDLSEMVSRGGLAANCSATL